MNFDSWRYFFVKKDAVSFCKKKYLLYFCTRKTEVNALLAQLVEQLTLNQWVQSSNL